ncbi:mucin-associated surface protein [Trypanosoma cruzi cruzi]|uniref:Mucin-associated surface protein (MASP) n=1 Tax=Trypanosoma cruzi TaxID=5693 RepID=A0A2V2US67_TRYCR|nr:mucin-associated surface protein [Trypanosoma cruzi cruzi]PWU86881.1 Mucin-associated surface protein (MASP) [Trypanosoma cruzi]
MAMMTGRVLLVCALCVLWCGAGGVVAEGSYAAETHEDPSGGLQSAPQLDPAKQPEETKPIEEVSNTAEQSLDAKEVKNDNHPKGSVKQTPTQNGGMEEHLKKGEGKKGEKDEKAEHELEGDQEQPLTGKDTTEDEKETTPALPENKEPPPPPPPAGAVTPLASDGNQPGDGSNLRNSASDGEIQPAADRMHSGGGAGSIPTGGGGKQSGQSGVSGGGHLPNPSSSGSSPRPPTHDGNAVLQDPGEDSSPPNKKSLEKAVQSETKTPAEPKVDEVPTSEPDPQQIGAEALVTVGGTGNEARREAEDMNEASSGKQLTNETEPLPPARGIPPEPDGTHTLPETNAVNSVSEKVPESNSLERPSEDGEAGQQDKEADTQGTREAEVTQGKAASPISTSGSGSAQSEADADGDDPQRPNPEGPQNDGTEAGDTHGPTAASDAAPQAAKATTAQTNGTVTPGDSDGSTAVPHTTSPLLLLLLVACAAAAAVVAA